MVEFREKFAKISLDFFKDEEKISVLIGQTGIDQFHAGIAIREKEGIYVLHLAFHHDLKYENINSLYGMPNYYGIHSSIHPDRHPSIKLICRMIYKKNQSSISYGFKYLDGKFSPAGLLELEDGLCGLTCATFVMAVFNSASIKLINTMQWLPRDDDFDWHVKMVDVLKRYTDISSDGFKAIEKEKGCARFRPEEVAISSSFDPLPAESIRIINEGETLVQAIKVPSPQ